MSLHSLTPRASFRIAVLTAAAGLSLGAALIAGGCNIASAVFYVVHGPDAKIPPKFELPRDKSTVVFVDDRNSKLPSRDLREMIASATGQVLMEKGAVNDLIDSRSAIAAASKDRFGSPMTISEIGRAVSADIVVYVTIDSFSLSRDGQTVAPSTAMRIKVIDAITEKRLWPEEPEGYALGVQSPPKQGTLSNSPGEMYNVRQEAASRAGLGVAQLFVEYIAREAAGMGSKATL
ncbi:MAG: hypothetical protein IT435_20390 [Phycisphaerales bacterium]|nr:hypothetical protein [Phycisphaerales bacterium]